MKNNIFAVVFFNTFLFSIFSLNAHASITVDGNLIDWGVTPAGYSGNTDNSDWVPDNGAIYTIENQKGGYYTYLGPGIGGQKFDAEAMYYKKEGSTVYLAIVTGLPQAGTGTWFGWYYPGDIALDFGADGIYDYGIKTHNGNAGKLYKNLTASSWNAGSVWPVAGEATIKNGSGTYLGTVPFIYNNDYYWSSNYYTYNRHYVMELGIPESYLPSGWMYKDTKIHWTETCGNDMLDLYIPRVPEPATMSLLGIGIAGLIGFKRKKKHI